MVDAPPPPPAWSSPTPAANPEPVGPPAGFWIRFLAYIVDAFILVLAMAVIGAVAVGLTLALGLVDTDMSELAIGAVVVLAIVTYFVIAWLYEALLTSGPRGATFGKQAVGVHIVRADGTRLSFGRATARYFCKVLVTPMIPLAIGYLMAGFTAGKRALHDIMADTLVIRNHRGW